MKHFEAWSQIESIIGEHDLLRHPFYQAWTAGKLTPADLKRYATDYYHHVSAFPACLSALHSRLPDGELRRSVLRNLCEEEIVGPAHSDLWLDFAEGMGAHRDAVRNTPPSPSMQGLIDTFREIASERAPLAALAAFYAYESQVARIAGLKAQGLKDFYGADARTCAYFVQHSTQDAHHSRVWAEQIDKANDAGEAPHDDLGDAVRDAATALWKSLDGIHQPHQEAATQPAC